MSQQFDYTSIVEEESHQNVANLVQAINNIPKGKRNNVSVSTTKGKDTGEYNIDELMPKLSQNIRTRIKNDITSIKEDLDLLGLVLVFQKKSGTDEIPLNAIRVDTSQPPDIIFRSAPAGIDEQYLMRGMINLPITINNQYEDIVNHLANLSTWVRICYCSNRKNEQGYRVCFFEYILRRDADPEALKTKLELEQVYFRGANRELYVIDNEDLPNYKQLV